MGESKNGFVISDHMDSSLPKKRKIRKRFIDHDNGMSSCSLWETKQQTDPRGEDKKEKQYKLRMNIRNVYISAETQLFSNRIHLGIVKF